MATLNEKRSKRLRRYTKFDKETHIKRYRISIGRNAGLVNAAFFFLILFAFIFLIFFYQSAPFLWEDAEQINLSTNISYAEIAFAYLNPLPNFYWEKTLVRDPSLADRPVQVFIAKFFNDLFGFTPFPYHFLKSIFLFSTVILLYYLIFKETKNAYPAMLASIMFLTAIPVYQSAMWTLDMELISQFFMLLIFTLFLNLYRDEKKRWKDTVPLQILILFLYLTAIKAKPSCSIIAPTLIAYIILTNYKKIKIYFPLCSIMLVIALLPKFLSPSPFYHQPVKFNQLKELLQQTVIVFGAPLLILLLFSVTAIAYSLKLKKNDKKLCELVLFFSLWSFFSVSLWLILPSSESRYLAQSVIPFSSLIAVSVFAALSLIPAKKMKKVFLILFLIPSCFQIWTNIKFDVHYRGFWGSFFIARDKAYSTIENNYSNSIIFYTFDWREIFYPFSGSTNKWIWINKGNINLPAILKKNNISIYGEGRIKAEKFENIFLVFPIKYPPKIPIYKKVRGKADTLFDSFAALFNFEIKEMNLMTLKLDDKTVYPVSFYIAKLK